MKSEAFGRLGGAAIAVAVIAIGGAGCKPSSVGEAEAKGDVTWLDAEGSPEAVEALGRLADKNPAAVAALKVHAAHEVAAYIAAWGGVKRGATWASDLLHAGLQAPDRAELAASAVDGRDPAIGPFLPDVEASLARLAATGATSTLAAVLAGAGPTAREAVARRLADKTTRGAMCGAIAGATASPEARETLRSAPVTSRDDTMCLAAVTTIAATDDPTLKWLAQLAEPGLLGAASRMTAIDCPRLQRLWTDAITSRGKSQGSALSVALRAAVQRCPVVLDGVLADAIKTKPDAITAVVDAIDPFSPDDMSLKQTCKALPLVASSGASAVAKERASDALLHGCKGTL